MKVSGEILVVLHLFEFFEDAHFSRLVVLKPNPKSEDFFSLVDDGFSFVDTIRRKLKPFDAPGSKDADFRADAGRYIYKGSKTKTPGGGGSQELELIVGETLDQALEGEIESRLLAGPKAPKFARCLYSNNKSLTLAVNGAQLVLQEFFDRVCVVEEDGQGSFETSTGPLGEFVLTFDKSFWTAKPISSKDEWDIVRILAKSFEGLQERITHEMKLLDNRLMSKLPEIKRAVLQTGPGSAEIAKNLSSESWRTEQLFTPFVSEVSTSQYFHKIYSFVKTKLPPAKDRVIYIEIYLNGLRTKSFELLNQRDEFYETSSFNFESDCQIGSSDLLSYDKGEVLFVVLNAKCRVKTLIVL